MEFAEDLPDLCPPMDAEDIELNDVFRLAPVDAPSIGHFASHAAQGRQPPKSLSDSCRWASCSLTTDPKKLRKLSKLKHNFAFRMRIPAGAGVSKMKSIHVDFWRASTFDPVAAVVQVEAIG